MTGSGWTSLVAAGCLVLAPSPGPAQQGSHEAAPSGEVFGATVEVEVINLDVVVTDRQGDPVTGLSRDDFELRVDGEPVEITNFAAVERGGEAAGLEGRAGAAPPAGPAAAAAEPVTEPAAEPLHLVLFVDDVHVGPGSRLRVFRQLREFLAGAVQPRDRVMLVSYDRSLDLRMPFTSDLSRIEAALAEMELAPATGQVSADLDRLRVIDQIRERQRIAIERHPLEPPCPADLGAIARAYAGAAYDDLLRTINALGTFVDSLAGLPGRKGIVHVSDGLPLRAGEEAFLFIVQLCDGTGAALDTDLAVDVRSMPFGDRIQAYDPSTTLADAAAFDAAPRYEALADRANAHRVTFYMLEAKGLQGFSSASAEHASRIATVETDLARVRNLQDSLHYLAAETGGRAILNANDALPGLARVAADLGTYYSLGFSPVRAGAGRDHPLKVEVRRPGLTVQHRKSYRDQSPDERAAARVLSALFHGVAEDPLGLDLVAEAPRAAAQGGGLLVVPIVVRVPVSKLTTLPQGDGHQGLFTLFMAVRDAEGGITPVRQTSVPIRVSAADIHAASGRHFVYKVDTLLKPGDVEVAIAVRDDLGGAVGYRVEKVSARRRL